MELNFQLKLGIFDENNDDEKLNEFWNNFKDAREELSNYLYNIDVYPTAQGNPYRVHGGTLG